jgi:hypothetical protein
LSQSVLLRGSPNVTDKPWPSLSGESYHWVTSEPYRYEWYDHSRIKSNQHGQDRDTDQDEPFLDPGPPRSGPWVGHRHELDQLDRVGIGKRIVIVNVECGAGLEEVSGGGRSVLCINGFYTHLVRLRSSRHRWRQRQVHRWVGVLDNNERTVEGNTVRCPSQIYQGQIGFPHG